jgi:RNA polymerase sigma-70 factor, ECF subfamily
MPLLGMEAALDTPASEPLTRDARQAQLVELARRGDRRAFAELVEPELAGAIGVARILARSHADAADAVQEALLSAWRGLDAIRRPESFPAWFRRHVTRAAMRSTRRDRVVELDVELAGDPDDLDRRLARRQLARAFDRLDDKDRLILTLHHFWGLPVAETAEHLAIPAGTVKSRVHHAMIRLRAAYDAEDRR